MVKDINPGSGFRHEPPSQRRHLRISAPLLIELEGQTFRTVDWSLGGVRLTGMHRPFERGEILDAVLSIPFQGFDIRFPARLEVVRFRPEEMELGARFVRLEERHEALLSYFIKALVAGEMETVDDVIRRIDIPVTPIPADVIRDRTAGAPLRRYSPKRLFIGALYLVVGLFIVGYIGTTLYSHLFRLQVESAVVSAPLESVQSPIAGVFAALLAEPGQVVEAGEPLARIRDPALEERRERAVIAVAEAEAALAEQEARLQVEEQDLKIYSRIAEERLREAQASVRSREKALDVASAKLERAQQLYAEGVVSEEFLDEAEDAVAAAADALAAARADLEVAQEGVAAAQGGTGFFSGERLEGQRGQEAAALARLRRQVELERAKLEAVEAQLAALWVRAPFTGRLVEVLKTEGNTVDRGDPLVVLERDEERIVAAFLTQSEILRVGLGREALVWLPALGRRLKARVAKIDRSTAFVDAVAQRYTWRGLDERTAYVALAFTGMDSETIRQSLPAGIPAVVIFRREPVNDILARVLSPLREGPPGPEGEP